MQEHEHEQVDSGPHEPLSGTFSRRAATTPCGSAVALELLGQRQVSQGEVLALQRSVGNARVVELLKGTSADDNGVDLMRQSLDKDEEKVEVSVVRQVSTSALAVNATAADASQTPQAENAKIWLERAKELVPRAYGPESHLLEIIDLLLEVIETGAHVGEIIAENLEAVELAELLGQVGVGAIGISFVLGLLKLGEANEAAAKLGHRNSRAFGRYAVVLFVFMHWRTGRFDEIGQDSATKLEMVPDSLRAVDMYLLPGTRAASSDPGFQQGVSEALENLRSVWDSDPTKRDDQVKLLLEGYKVVYESLMAGHRAYR